MIRDHAQMLLRKRASAKAIGEAIDFFFTLSLNDEEITFGLCCEVLRARPDVVRLRIQYEWWLRGTIFTGPFPFSTVPLPALIAGELLYFGGQEGVALAREAWVQPGMTTRELVDVVQSLDGYTKNALHRALERLDERLLMSCNSDRWYVTGRNPLSARMRERAQGTFGGLGSSICWSRYFGQA